MQLGLLRLFILCGLQLPVKTAASYGCGYESLKSSKAMCFMKFHCGTENAKTNTDMLYRCTTYAEKALFNEEGAKFLTFFPVCCLHPLI